MNQEWDGKPLEDLLSQDAAVQEEGTSVWTFLDYIGAGLLLRVTSPEAFSLALNEVFLEMYHNVLKRVRSPLLFLWFAWSFCSYLWLASGPVCRVTCGKKDICAGTGQSVGLC